MLAAAAGAPVALLVGDADAGPLVCRRWPGRLAVLLLTLLDACSAPARATRDAVLTLPRTASVGESVEAIVSRDGDRARARRAAREVAIASDALVAIERRRARARSS